MSIEKKKYECSALPKGWQREEVIRKSGLSAGKVDVYYYSPNGKKFRSKPQLARYLGDTLDLATFDFRSGKVNSLLLRKNKKQRGTQFDYSFRKQTLKKRSIPYSLFWEKRLEGLHACDLDGFEFDAMELPRALRAVGPHVGEETLLQSVATALHVSAQPVTGQTGSRSALEKNPGVFLNPDQPLVQAVSVGDEDIKRQEERVATARKKLQDALKRYVA